MNDIISNPSHYCDTKYEPKDVIRDWGLNFNLGSTVKYIKRAGKKDGNSALQDLKKARQFIDFEIEYQESDRPAIDVLREQHEKKMLLDKQIKELTELHNHEQLMKDIGNAYEDNKDNSGS